MAKLTTKQSKDLQKQIDEARRQIDTITRSRALTSAPAGQVAGASTSKPLNAAQMGGASGIGFETEEDQNEISSQVDATIKTGGSKSQAGDSLSSAGAFSLLQSNGLDGLFKASDFAGKSRGEASRLIQQEKAKRQAQISPTTSAVFNSETIGKTKRAVDNLGFALNDITNSPFNGKTSKLNKTQGLIESTSKELAKLFKTPEEFNQAYNTNQTFKDAIDRFQKAGGKADMVTSSIVQPTAMPEQGVQTTADYLAGINNPQANQEAQTKAINELVPEREADQAEIARQAGIPEELKRVYFGDEQTTGLLAQREAEAKEEIRISEQEEKNEKASLKAKAKYAIQKNNAEVKLQSAKIEQNRLAAKNYMTGYLAKLGALNTTGAAGLAIQTLDTQYEMKRNELETTAKYANQALELNLTTDINNVETETDKEILKIQQDLTKTTEEVFKEVTKAQQAADKEIYNITAGYTKTLRERTTKYTEDLKKEAEKYAKAYAKTASGGLDLGKLSQSINSGELMEGQYVPKKGVLLPNGTFAKISLTPAQQQDVEAAGIQGLSNIRFFNNLPTAVREQIIRDTVATGTKYDVAKMQAVLKQIEDAKKAKEDDTDFSV